MENNHEEQSVTKILPDSVKQILDKPLPQEALKAKPGAANLSSINSIYVTERFNEAFGVGEWSTKVEFVAERDKTASNGTKSLMVVTKTTFTVPKYNIHYECYGGNDNADYGDAFKGSTTDAITKIGSWLGIGADIWKNKQSHLPPKQPQQQPRPQPQPQQPKEKGTIEEKGSKSYNDALAWLLKDPVKNTISKLQANYIVDAKSLTDLAIDAGIPTGGTRPSETKKETNKTLQNEQSTTTSAV